MKNNFKKFLCGVSVLALSGSVLAAPTITFQGEVTDQTCSVAINGASDAQVLLPTVSIKEFGESGVVAGSEAGLTPFTISLTGCTAPNADTTIKTEFLGHDVDSATGSLGNTYSGADSAKDFSIHLYQDAEGTEAIKLNGITSVDNGFVLKANQTTASSQFSVKYQALSTAATAGKITAVTEYTISYK